MEKNLNDELLSANERVVGRKYVNKAHMTSQWARKIDDFIVICIYEQNLKNEADDINTRSMQLDQQKINSFIIWQRAYKDSEALFINLRVAARNQMITHISKFIVDHLKNKYESRLQANSERINSKRIIFDEEKARNAIENFIKNHTFLADYAVWDEFCVWLQVYLTEWTLDEMQKSIGLKQMEALSNQELNQLFYQYISKNLSVNNEFIAKFSDIVDEYISVWIDEIIIFMDMENYTNEKIESMLFIQNTSDLYLQTIPQKKDMTYTLTIQDFIQVMNNAAYQNVREALYKNNFRQLTSTLWPTTPLYKGNMEGYVQFRPPFSPEESEADSVEDLAWKQAKEVTDLDVDLFDALCSIFLSKARHSQDLIEIYFDDLLLMRGLKAKLGGEGRRGGYEHKQRKQILKSLTKIQSLWMEIERAIVYEKGKPIEMKLQGRTFLFKDNSGKERRILDMADTKKFYFTVDKVFAKFLYGSGRQVALLPIQTLRYNPYHQTWEKRLARYISWRWRTQARKGDFLQPNKIRTLLDTIGEEMNIRTPSRTRERLEKALDTLQADGVLADWYYDKWEESIADHKGWARLWLNCTIIIEPPTIIKEHYHSIERVKKAKYVQEKPLGMESLESIGEQLRITRTRLRLTLSQVAEELEVSPSYVSHIERGIKIPSIKLQNRLVNWLKRFD